MRVASGLVLVWRLRRNLAIAAAAVAGALLFSASTHNVSAGGRSHVKEVYPADAPRIAPAHITVPAGASDDDC